MTPERPNAITKQLSRNDSGETGAHQAGLVIPRDPHILAFFPPLDARQKNPRHHLTFEDSSGKRWGFSFIYYNNRFFGGTRNEYRLTCMTPFIHQHGLRAGDTITLSRDTDGYHIRYRRRNEASSDGPLKLGSTWRVIRI